MYMEEQSFGASNFDIAKSTGVQIQYKYLRRRY